MTKTPLYKTMKLHPQEAALIEHIRELGFGTIDGLKIQHSLPFEADILRRRIKFVKKDVKEEK